MQKFGLLLTTKKCLRQNIEYFTGPIESYIILERDWFVGRFLELTSLSYRENGDSVQLVNFQIINCI